MKLSIPSVSEGSGILAGTLNIKAALKYAAAIATAIILSVSAFGGVPARAEDSVASSTSYPLLCGQARVAEPEPLPQDVQIAFRQAIAIAQSVDNTKVTVFTDYAYVVVENCEASIYNYDGQECVLLPSFGDQACDASFFTPRCRQNPEQKQFCRGTLVTDPATGEERYAYYDIRCDDPNYVAQHGSEACYEYSD